MKKNFVITALIIVFAIVLAAIIIPAVSSIGKVDLSGNTWEVEVSGGDLGDYTYEITFLNSKKLVCDKDEFEGTYEIIDGNTININTDWGDGTHTRDVYSYEVTDKSEHKIRLYK